MTASSLIAAGLFLTATTARAANTVTQVQVVGGKVQIDTSAPPNFTTFTMTNPPRLVVDVAECTFEGGTGEVPVGKYGITTINMQAYGSGSSAIARVLIAFTKDTDTNISTSGTSIIVAPTGAAGPAVAAAKPAAAPRAPTPAAVEAPAPAPTPPPPAAPAPIAVAAATPPPPAPMAETPAPAPAASPESAAPAAPAGLRRGAPVTA